MVGHTPDTLKANKGAGWFIPKGDAAVNVSDAFGASAHGVLRIAENVSAREFSNHTADPTYMKKLEESQRRPEQKSPAAIADAARKERVKEFAKKHPETVIKGR